MSAVDVTARPNLANAVDANEAITIQLVGDPAQLTRPDQKSFHPAFTYPFWGEDQLIEGYENLQVRFLYCARSLATCVLIKYDYKCRDAIDLLKPLIEYLPKDVIYDEAEFVKCLNRSTTTKPCGQQVHSYQVNDQSFDIFQCSIETDGFRQMYHRMKILPIFFIEGATSVDITDPQWTFYMTWHRTATGTHEFVSMSSVYAYYMWPDRVRRRISQVLVLPPWQRQGHARAMYMKIHDLCMFDPKVLQLAVEDPSEAFDALRDICDLVTLLTPRKVSQSDENDAIRQVQVAGIDAIPEVSPAEVAKACKSMGVRAEPLEDGCDMDPLLRDVYIASVVGTTLAIATVVATNSQTCPALKYLTTRTDFELCSNSIRAARIRGLCIAYKLQPKQAERIYEMLLLHSCNQVSTCYRLMVKSRIYRANKDVLAGLGADLPGGQSGPAAHALVKQKVHEAYQLVVEEYRSRISNAQCILQKYSN